MQKGWSTQSISRFRSTFCKGFMWLDANDYPVKPDGTVAPMHLTLYFSEWRAKFHERQVQTKLVKVKRDASQQAKDIMTPPLPPAREGHDVPGVQSVGVDETPRTGNKKGKKKKRKSPRWFMVWTPRILRSQMGTR